MIGALLALAACDHGFADPSRIFADTPPGDREYPTVVHEPTAFGVLDTPLVSDAGDKDIPAGTACTTCHGPAAGTPPETTEQFHTNVEITHGTLSCGQCHDATDRTRLRLADGTPVAFGDVMTLCGQCHGPQDRDYRHDAHGGMNGYWDTRQGPRMRNNCVDCHSPHEPAYEPVMPVFPPRDRYLGGGHHE